MFCCEKTASVFCWEKPVCFLLGETVSLFCYEKNVSVFFWKETVSVWTFIIAFSLMNDGIFACLFC